MAKRYRYAFAKKKEALKGKYSVGLAIASLVLFLGDVILAFFLEGELGFLVGGIGLFGAILAVYGFILGLRSFSETGVTHRTSIIGSMVNGVFMVVWLGIFLMGV